MVRQRDILMALGLTAIAAASIAALLSALGPDWRVYAPATCTATRCFCEAPRTGALILQPANAWSNAGYVFAGFLMILLARGPDWRSAFPPAAATVLGIAAILVGLGSVLLHATLTLWGQFFDVAGMYFVSGFMAISALAAWRGLSARQAAWAYAGLLMLLLAVLYQVPEVRRWLFAVVLLAAIAVELGFARRQRRRAKLGYYLAGMLTNAMAFAIWNLDQYGLVCAPQSLVQGHAIWHLLGAVALWLAFLYYRSEAPGGGHGHQG